MFREGRALGNLRAAGDMGSGAGWETGWWEPLQMMLASIWLFEYVLAKETIPCSFGVSWDL